MGTVKTGFVALVAVALTIAACSGAPHAAGPKGSIVGEFDPSNKHEGEPAYRFIPVIAQRPSGGIRSFLGMLARFTHRRYAPKSLTNCQYLPP